MLNISIPRVALGISILTWEDTHAELLQPYTITVNATLVGFVKWDRKQSPHGCETLSSSGKMLIVVFLTGPTRRFTKYELVLNFGNALNWITQFNDEVISSQRYLN